MLVFVHGIRIRIHVLQVNPLDTVGSLKQRVKEREELESDPRLIFSHQAKILEDEQTLEHYGIENDANIMARIALLGGAKKRKKKNYTTPKKNKHKKKKVKLAVLKFYKVDDTGKITRLRRECENKECGAGVFMANHFDRHYCGRCGLTLVYNKPEDK